MARKTRKRGQHSVKDADAAPDSIDSRAAFDPAPATAIAAEVEVVEAVETNTQLLQQLLQQVGDLRAAVVGESSDRSQPLDEADQDEQAEVCEFLRQQIRQLEDQVCELQQQNNDLASQVANSSVQQTVSTPQGGSSEALSWEERKQMILQQMEADTFDAEEFVASLPTSSEASDSDDQVQMDDGETPQEFVSRLNQQLQQRNEELQRREKEIEDLRFLLEQQPEARGDGTAVGAAAIAEMIDADELIQQERERLQILQEEWEEKFRQGEIEASLERAKLSRERQELAKKQAELEEQLEHIRRESRQQEHGGAKNSRRWMAKLGLTDD